MHYLEHLFLSKHNIEHVTTKVYVRKGCSFLIYNVEECYPQSLYYITLLLLLHNMISPAPTWEPPTGDGGNKVFQAVDQLSVQGPHSKAPPYIYKPPKYITYHDRPRPHIGTTNR